MHSLAEKGMGWLDYTNVAVEMQKDLTSLLNRSGLCHHSRAARLQRFRAGLGCFGFQRTFKQR
jgi:hypothetical protein